MDPHSNQIIAIDGPAASGKSTVAKELAARLGYLYFDTGVMYRAATLAALRDGISIGDEAGVSEKAGRIEIDVQPPSLDDGRQYDVLLDGEDVTWDIRSEAVDANVSQVSAYSGVRKAMTARQREIGHRENVVMVGRDIATVVVPEAQHKLYLDASVEARAQRRFDERIARGEEVDYQEILESMRQRDQIDSNREVAPLKVAENAIVIDSTDMTIEDVIERALELVT